MGGVRFPSWNTRLVGMPGRWSCGSGAWAGVANTRAGARGVCRNTGRRVPFCALQSCHPHPHPHLVVERGAPRAQLLQRYALQGCGAGKYRHTMR
jgi:hypothetical protein